MLRKLLLGVVIALTSVPAFATAWGMLQVAAEREWTTEKEPRPRVTKYRWVEPGKVLEARHGFVSRLQFGEGKFADTVQRFVLDPKTGKIAVTYTYEDGRPPLKAVIEAGEDGSLVETFTDAKGVKKRNIYKSPSPSVSLIERQEMQGGKWTTLGTTRKGGLTQFEIAEIVRKKEAARQMAIAQENARRAAEQARRAAEERAYAESQSYQQEEQPMMGGMNMLDVLNGLGASIQQQNVQQQQAFDRQMQSYSSGSSSSNGTIIMDNSPAPTYAPPASPTSQVPSVQPAPSSSTGAFTQGQSSSGCKTFWHRPNPQNYTYERCSPGEPNCTCADSSTVSPQ